jgi:hypothetical protein
LVGLLLLAFLGGTLAQVAASPVPVQHPCVVAKNLGSHDMPCKPMPPEPGTPACVVAIGCGVMAMLAPDLPSMALRQTPVWYSLPPTERAGRSIKPDLFPPILVA